MRTMDGYVCDGCHRMLMQAFTTEVHPHEVYRLSNPARYFCSPNCVLQIAHDPGVDRKTAMLLAAFAERWQAADYIASLGGPDMQRLAAHVRSGRRV